MDTSKHQIVPSKYRLRRYYRRFLRWRTNVYSYQHFKISVSGFIQFSTAVSVVLPPQICFLPDMSPMNTTFTLYEVLSISPRFSQLLLIFENIRVRSAAIKVYKNVGVINQSQYIPNALYFGFYYATSSSAPTYDTMVGSDLCRLVNYDGETRWYVKFKSKLQNVKELGDTVLQPLRLGCFSNMQGNINSQPTFNFNIDFYVTFNNCKV